VGPNPLSYSGKTVLSISDYRKRQNTAMVAPKLHKGSGGQWVVINREPNSKYEMDPVSYLVGLGDVTEKKLKKQGLVTIKDIKNLSGNQMEAISKLEKVDRIGLPQMLGFQEQAKKAILGRPPEKTDYRKAENPWKARYGDDWEEKLDQSSLMSPYCSIKTLVENMVSECERMFKGTIHEHDWLFFHDALSLLTAHETVSWMKEKGYYKRWVLPELGLHSDDPDLKNYCGRPVGNSPENMPWDTSLNKDLHDAVKYHVAATADFEKADPRKFDMTTPKKGTWAYRRVLQVYPLPKRVIQDVEKVFLSMKIVRDAKGIKVDGVGNSSGKRHVKSSSASRGGYRPRKQRHDNYGEKVLHDDAKVGNTIKLADSVNRAQGKKIVGSKKWVKKEASPQKPNEKRMRQPEVVKLKQKRMRTTENEAETDEEMPMSPPQEKE
jgi:predicted flap endonuclease-1-like 5' DNA nuclease